MPDPVTELHDGDVAVITLDDSKANALSFTVLDGLNDALSAAENDAKAVALVGRVAAPSAARSPRSSAPASTPA